MVIDSYALVDFVYSLQSGEQIGGENRLVLNLVYMGGMRYSSPDYPLRSVFHLHSQDLGWGIKEEAETDLDTLLEYIGHSFEECLLKHQWMRENYAYALSHQNLEAYGISLFQEFWDSLAREIAFHNSIKRVHISVLVSDSDD
jgi:hypothetical protein